MPLYTLSRRIFSYCSRQIFRLRAKRIEALPEVLKEIANYEVISFDIFDTLLRRDIEPPDLTKRSTAKRAELLFHSRGIPLTQEHFTYQRDRAEAFLRRQALDKDLDTECGLDEILSLALSRILGRAPDETDVQHLVNYELEYDIRHLSPMPGCKDLLRQVKEMGKTVIVISDMYYRKPQLLQIFKALNIADNVDNVYVSSENKIAKHSARLFTYVLEQLDISAEKLIHIGDNLHSDVLSPAQLGISSVWFNSRQEHIRRRQLEKQQRKDRLVSQVMEQDGDLSKRTHFESSPTSVDLAEFRRMGRDYFGPSFCAFTLNLIDSVIRDGIDDVYFLSRDGDIFMKLFNVLKTSIRRYQQITIPEARYLYVSRRSTTLPACRHFGSREYEIAGLDPQDCGPNALVRKMGLQEEAFTEIINRHFSGKRNTFSKKSKTKHQFDQLFQDEDFLRKVEIERTEAADLVKRYLNQEGFFGARKSNALVDIGWNATVQVNLARAFCDDSDFPEMQGYYFGRDYASFNDYTLSIKSRYTRGFAYDNIRYQPIAFFMPFFEFAACAPHGSTVGYIQRENGRMEPILDSNYSHQPEQTALQEGIMDYAQGFAERYDLNEPDVDALRDAANGRLKQLAFYPSKSQVQALRQVVIDADWGGKGSHTL